MNEGLKYPVLLVHGMGFRDNKFVCYWGRIPKIYESLGCKVYFGNQDSNATTETNARVLANKIEQILKETGAEKVNIIAHSKGGMDSRYAITHLNMANKVASLTTLSTPHNGSKTMDILMKFPHPIIRFGCFFVDIWFKILGDKHPETFKVLLSFTTSKAKEFNSLTPDKKEVFYQSYAFVMENFSSDIFMWFPSFVVNALEGENDGLLTPEAVKWGEFKGVFKSESKRGISHCDEVDMRRRRFTKKKGENLSDITDLYKNVFFDLKAKGF